MVAQVGPKRSTILNSTAQVAEVAFAVRDGPFRPAIQQMLSSKHPATYQSYIATPPFSPWRRGNTFSWYHTVSYLLHMFVHDIRPRGRKYILTYPSAPACGSALGQLAGSLTLLLLTARH